MRQGGFGEEEAGSQEPKSHALSRLLEPPATPPAAFHAAGLSDKVERSVAGSEFENSETWRSSFCRWINDDGH